ncbi:MAG: outer membrane beta-barrel protein [Bacteroidales bacterium]|nr:outer membrane beta-barrel protein [Bacteroidales bacterium]
MKKLFAIALAAALILPGRMANAQVAAGAGIISSSLTGRYNGNEAKSSTATGYYAGASYVLELPYGILLTPGAYLSCISKQSDNGLTIGPVSQNTKTKFNEWALNIPVYATYGTASSADTKVFLYLGPTLQLGLSSKSQSNTKGSQNAANSDVNYYADGYFHRFNIYFGGGVGATLKEKYVFTLGYHKGLLDLYAGDKEKTSYYRSNFLLSFNYLF